MSAAGVVDRALARAAVHRLLGAAFAYPGPGRLEEVARLARAAAAAPGLPEGLRPPVLRVAAGADATEPAQAAAEHVELFTRQVRCPPYEGAWGPPQMAGKAARLADVAGFYVAFGLQPSAGTPDTEDHIGAELEFMSTLALREAWAIAGDQTERAEVARTAQATFVTDHLGTWAAAFADALAAVSTTPYSRAAAALLAAWVAAEIEALGATPALASGPGSAAEAEAFSCPMAPEANGETA